MALTLKPLPFAYEAMEPTMSAETLKFHHDKHHATYVKTANDLIAGTKYAELSLDELVKAAHKDGEKKLFNNAAQIFNHDFFWDSLSAKPTKPSKALADAVDTAFGSLEKFNEAFVAKGIGHFASGWVWLAMAGGKLELVDTHDADTPALHDKTPLLTCDVWEHAYYIDTRNDRKAFLTGFVEKLINWDHASKLFGDGSKVSKAA